IDAIAEFRPSERSLAVSKQSLSLTFVLLAAGVLVSANARAQAPAAPAQPQDQIQAAAPAVGDQTEIARLYERGLDHEEGRGVQKDHREAARLYRLAAEQGDARAQNALGRFFEDGRGGLPKDGREAVRLYRLAADQGYD